MGTCGMWLWERLGSDSTRWPTTQLPEAAKLWLREASRSGRSGLVGEGAGVRGDVERATLVSLTRKQPF